jgi:hypothetical protein
LEGFTIIGNFGSGTQCYYVVSVSETGDYIYTIDDVLQDSLCNESICTDYCPTPEPTPTVTPTQSELALVLIPCEGEEIPIIGNFRDVGSPITDVVYIEGNDGTRGCYTNLGSSPGDPAQFLVLSMVTYETCEQCKEGPIPTPPVTPSNTPTRTVTPTVTRTPTRTPTPSPGVVYNSLGLLASGFNNRTEYIAPATTPVLSTICNAVRTLGGGDLPGTEGHVYYTGDCSTITSSATAPGKILYALTDVGIDPFYAPLEFQSVTNGCQGWLTGAGGVILSTYPSFCSGGSGGCINCDITPPPEL